MDVELKRLILAKRKAEWRLLRINELIADWMDRLPHLSYFQFSARTFNALCSAGITETHQLIIKTPPELLSIRCFGKRCLEEVENGLREKNLSLFETNKKKDEDGERR
ncbi:DNA-directed RNA polymerase subunit alpha C-terminal domain-containing protein [Sulfuricurvum sp.]|uniref:DNA-directed RNA polymerase subunit alpha C-terminal domain-containing protein n=1 Tax=Sulfuricurvum sp. TaxID=2025608 RepID=UPI00356A91A1